MKRRSFAPELVAAAVSVISVSESIDWIVAEAGMPVLGETGCTCIPTSSPAVVGNVTLLAVAPLPAVPVMVAAVRCHCDTQLTPPGPTDPSVPVLPAVGALMQVV